MIRAAVQNTKTCTKCGEVKLLSEFYAKKKRKDGGTVFDGQCKQCKIGHQKQRHKCETCDASVANGGRCKSCYLQAIRERKDQRAAELDMKRHELRDWQLTEAYQWERAARRELSKLKNRSKQLAKTKWKKRCQNAIASIASRKRTTPNVKKVRDEHLPTTWEKACTKQREALRGVLRRAKKDAWEKKCDSVARNWRRKILLA